MIKIKFIPFVIVISIGLFFSPNNCNAEENYILYGVTKYLILYYNPGSITRPSKDIIRLQIKLVSKCKDSKEWTVKDYPNCSNIDWDYVITLTEINCSSRQDRDVESVGYNQEGKPLEFSSTETSQWSDIIPESYTEFLYKLVCH